MHTVIDEQKEAGGVETPSGMQVRLFPHYWKLSPAQDRILALLTRKGAASKREIAAAAAGFGEGSMAAVKAHISLLKTALEDRSIGIYNIRGWGYELDLQSLERLRRFLAVRPAAAKERI